LIDLVGEIEAFKLIDLDRERLSEYKAWLERYLKGSQGGQASPAALQFSIEAIVCALLSELSSKVDQDSKSKISINEIKKTLNDNGSKPLSIKGQSGI
jgi:hypothetical protein